MSKDKMAKDRMMKSGTIDQGPTSDDALGKANTPASSGNALRRRTLAKSKKSNPSS
jgi:hypothetical protein